MTMPHRQCQTTENSHGRKDGRCYVLAKVPEDFAVKEQWPGLKAVGMAVRVTETADGTATGDVRYFIASRYLIGEPLRSGRSRPLGH